jgi:hypothetical protein
LRPEAQIKGRLALDLLRKLHAEGSSRDHRRAAPCEGGMTGASPVTMLQRFSIALPPGLAWTDPFGLKTRPRRPRGALQAGRMLMPQGGGRGHNPLVDRSKVSIFQRFRTRRKCAIGF